MDGGGRQNKNNETCKPWQENLRQEVEVASGVHIPGDSFSTDVLDLEVRD